jgi:regulator of protease activity HflC (stomatin/prohibitin superfamily)
MIGSVVRSLAALLAIVWLTANIRPVPPGNQALILRFGAVVRVQRAGLVLAWPPPLERVLLLPDGERRMVLDGGAQQFLTADGGVVGMRALLDWRVSDPDVFAPEQAQVAPVFEKLFLAAAVSLAAGRRVNELLSGAPPAGDCAAPIEGGLAELAASGAGLGVAVQSCTITASLPAASDKILARTQAAAQAASQSVVAARAEAAVLLQQADAVQAKIFADARAEAAERIGFARSVTATVTALETRINPATRPALLADLYRERIAAVLRRAGSVSTVDAKSVSKLILPGAGP